MQSKYFFNLIAGRCPKCGKIFVDRPNEPEMIYCPDKKCGFAIDTETFFNIVEEYQPVNPVPFENELEKRMEELNNLEL